MANNVKKFEETARNAKHFKNNEMEVKSMLQATIDLILYIPRKVYFHFENYKRLEKENKELKEALKNRNRLLRRISYDCDYYKQSNQILHYEGFKKIKELANTFGNETNSL